MEDYIDKDIIYFNGKIDENSFLSKFNVNSELLNFARTTMRIMEFNKEDDFSDYFINMEDDELTISKGSYEFYHTVKGFGSSEYIQMTFKNIDEDRELQLSYRCDLSEDAIEILNEYLFHE